MTEVVKKTNPTEKLWRVAVSGLVKATTEEEAKEKTEKGYLLVEDVIGVEPENLAHFTIVADHDAMTKRIFDALSLVEKNPATDW